MTDDRAVTAPSGYGEHPPEDLHTQSFQTIFVITMSTIGLVANLCAFIVVIKSSIIETSMGIYLAFLSIFDNLALAPNLARSGTVSDFADSNIIACKIATMGSFSFMSVSINMVVCMTIDRVYIITNPHRPNPERRTALMIAIIVTCVSTLVYSIHCGIMYGIVNVTNDAANSTFQNAFIVEPRENFTTSILSYSVSSDLSVCTVAPRYLNYYQSIFNAVDAVTWGLLAPLIALICNIIIIVYLKKSSRVAPMNSTAVSNHDKRVTRLLLLVSLCFIICLLPSGIYFSLIPYLYRERMQAFAADNLAWQATLDLLIINQSLNYFLYIASGKKFRNEAKTVFKSICECLREKINCFN